MCRSTPACRLSPTRSLLTLGLLLALAPPARAAVTFGADASVWDSSVPPSATELPIGGSGQINGEFTLDTVETGGGAIQVGLRAQERFVGPVLPRFENVYFADSGTSSGGPPPRATWNFDYHMDFGTSFLASDLGLALTPLNLRDYDVVLSVDTDPSAATSFVNTDYNALLDAFMVGPDIRLFQDSQNIGFGGLGGPLDPTVSPAFYDFALTVSSGGVQVARSSILVAVDSPTLCANPTFVSVAGAGGTGFEISGTPGCVYDVRITENQPASVEVIHVPVDTGGTGGDPDRPVIADSVYETGPLGLDPITDTVVIPPLPFVAEVPTASEAGLAVLALLLAAVALVALRR